VPPGAVVLRPHGGMMADRRVVRVGQWPRERRACPPGSPGLRVMRKSRLACLPNGVLYPGGSPPITAPEKGVPNPAAGPKAPI